MNQDRGRLGGIHRELDAAFATVQSARSRRDLGYEGAQRMARECVASTAANIRRQLFDAPLSEGEARLVEAKLRALIDAAGRIPGPDGAPGRDPEPPKPARAGR